MTYIVAKNAYARNLYLRPVSFYPLHLFSI